MQIFIVDDDQDFAESMADVLEMHGHEVKIAFSGEEAVEKFRKEEFDLAFMDVRLPGMNGVESFLEIRKIRPFAKVVMMTAYSVEQLLEQAVENGAWGVLQKPFDMGQLLRLVENAHPKGVVLIADDDHDFAMSIRELLEQNSYKVLVAHDGAQALQTVRSNGVDVLILDLRMPVLDGLDVYLELKKQGQSLATLLVTAYVDEEKQRIEAFEQMSRTGILQKPFDPQELVRAIERLMQGSQAV